MLRYEVMARSLAACTALATLLVLNGCGADHSAGVDLTPTEEGGAGGEGGSPELPPPPPDCATGDVAEGSVYYEIGGVTNCFVGVQVCVDGVWETCTDQEAVDARLEELEAAGELGAAGAGGGSTGETAGGAGGARG